MRMTMMPHPIILVPFNLLNFLCPIGEEDQNVYDISRLRKPDDTDTMHKMPYDPLMERYQRRG